MICSWMGELRQMQILVATIPPPMHSGQKCRVIKLTSMLVRIAARHMCTKIHHHEKVHWYTLHAQIHAGTQSK